MSSISGDKKVDMSSDAIAAYYRKLKDARTDLPSAPSLGIPRNPETATNVARLATKKEPVAAMARPDKSSDAARASILANANPRSVAALQSGRANSLQSSAAAAKKSLYHNNPSQSSQAGATNSAAASAATKVISTSGEDYARKYLSHGYNWSDRNGRTSSLSSVDISKVDLSKLHGAAAERAKQRLADVQIITHRESPESAAQHQYDIKNAITVYQIAEQRVKDSLARVDKSNADKSVYGSHEDRQKAYEIASKAASARSSITDGKRNLGGGLFMNDDEIMSIARRLVEPDLDTISKLVADRHEADRIAAEEKAAALQAKQEEKERQRQAAEEEKTKKAEAKAKQREESAKLKQQQADAKAAEAERRAAEKRQAKEREHISSLEAKAKEAETTLAAIKAGNMPEDKSSDNSLWGTKKVMPTPDGAKAKADISKGNLSAAEKDLSKAEKEEAAAREAMESIVAKHRALKEQYHSQRGEEVEQHKAFIEKWKVEALERAVHNAEKEHKVKKEHHERQQAMAQAEYRIKNAEGKLWPKKSTATKKTTSDDADKAEVSEKVDAPESIAESTNEAAAPATELSGEEDVESKPEEVANEATDDIPVAGAAITEPTEDKAESVKEPVEETPEVPLIADEPANEEAEQKSLKPHATETAAEEEPTEDDGAPKIEPYKEFDPESVKISEPEPSFANSASLDELKTKVKTLKAERNAAEQRHAVALKDLEIAKSKVAALTSEFESLVALESELRTREETAQRQAKMAAEREANNRQEALLKARLESTTLSDLEKAQVEAEFTQLKKKKLDLELAELKEKAEAAEKEASENDERAKQAAEALEAAKAKEEERKAAEKEAAEAAKKAAVEQELADAKEAQAAAEEKAAKEREALKDEAGEEAAAEGEKLQEYDQAAEEAAAEGEKHQEYDEAAEEAATEGKRLQEYDQVAEEAAAEGEKKQEYDQVAEEAAALGEKKEEYNETAEQAAEVAAAREPSSVTEKVEEPLGDLEAKDTSKQSEDAQQSDKNFEGFDSANEKPAHGIFTESI